MSADTLAFFILIAVCGGVGIAMIVLRFMQVARLDTTFGVMQGLSVGYGGMMALEFGLLVISCWIGESTHDLFTRCLLVGGLLVIPVAVGIRYLRLRHYLRSTEPDPR